MKRFVLICVFFGLSSNAHAMRISGGGGSGTGGSSSVSTLTITGLGPGVVHIVAGSSVAVTGLVLSTEIANTTVVPNTYVNATITVNAEGQITSASNGGSGSGSSNLAVGTGTLTNFTTNVTSPTAAIAFNGALFRATTSGTTSFINLDTVSANGLLMISSAAGTYITQSSSGSFIFNQNVLQSGSTFYTSSGTALNFNASTATLGVWLPQSIPLLALNSPTPSIQGGNVFISSNTTLTTITNFSNGTNGQIIAVNFASTNTTIANNANIDMTGNANYLATINTTIFFVLQNNVWHEAGRGGGNSGTVLGSGAPNQVAFWTSTSQLSSSSTFIYNPVSGFISIGTTTNNQAQVMIVSSGTIIPFMIQDPVFGGGTGVVDLTEWKNSNGQTISSVTADGSIVTNSTASMNVLNLYGTQLIMNGSTYTVPSNAGSVNQFLQTNGATPATLTWAGAILLSNILQSGATFYTSSGTAIQFNASTITIGNGNGGVYPYTPLSVIGTANNYLQIVLQNLSNGNNASSDYIATSNLGNDSSQYIDMGINSSGYNQSSYSVTPTTWGYLYTSDHGLAIGANANNTDASSKVVIFTSAPINQDIRQAWDNSGGIEFPGLPNGIMHVIGTTVSVSQISPSTDIAAGILPATVQVSSLASVIAGGQAGSATISPTIIWNPQGQIIGFSSNTISGSGGGTPGGVDTDVQFNQTGVFQGTATLTMNATSNFLVIGATTQFTSVATTTWQNVSTVTWGNGSALVMSTSTNFQTPSGQILNNASSVTVQGVFSAGTNITFTSNPGATIINASGGASGSFIYPSTGTPNFQFGLLSTTGSFTGVVTISTALVISSGSLSATMSYSTSVFGLLISTNEQVNGTLTVISGSTQPSTITTGLIVSGGAAILQGMSTGTLASAGNYGESFSSRTTGASNLPATTTWGDLLSIALTTGAWQVTYQGCEQSAGATLTAGGFIAISTSSGNNAGGLFYPDNEIQLPLAATTDGCDTIAGYQMNFNANTTIYAKMQDAYTLGQPTMKGRFSAIRPY